jgi:NADPH2:quinone reductase
VRAVIYDTPGDPDVLRIVERPIPQPGPGEVRVVVRISGVNPTDWKTRRGQLRFPQQVPNQDGAGVVDAVGSGVDEARVGERVWLWEAAWQRADGTAQEYVVLPSRQAVALPDDASFDLGASLGIPALTAHRCLTVADGGPHGLAPGALSGRTVLVAGGAGAVGNAAIQLAVWSGAQVVTTVSSARKAELARAAGAHHVVNYREERAAEAIRSAVPGGVDIVVEVAPGANAAINAEVLAPNGVVAIYATDGAGDPPLPLRRVFALNARWQGVLVYTVPTGAKDQAVADVADAVTAGALRVGEHAGLPLLRFPLERTADAHAAVEGNAVGKVLVTIE